MLSTHPTVSRTGHGNIAPRTTLGRIVTMVYAILGIPLTLVYLSSTGGVLAKVARGVFSRYVTPPNVGDTNLEPNMADY